MILSIAESIEKCNEYERKACSEDDDYLTRLDNAKLIIKAFQDAIAAIDDLEPEYKYLDTMLIKIRNLKESRIERVLSRGETEYEPN